MPLEDVLRALRRDPNFIGSVTAWERLPAHPARYAAGSPKLDTRLGEAFAAQGIQALYVHQAEAIEATLAGENVVVATGTASGKTLCYNLPALHWLLRDPAARALYLFPTKALAQDQLAALDSMLDELDEPRIPAHTYDGDTPSGQRAAIRRRARILLSNPDMLHMGILPYHTRWADFFAGLRLVVLDELHTYRGVFGSHLANVFRRLRRVCRFYGSAPVFICTSATMANPQELAGRLLETPVHLIDDDGSPGGEKHVILYNPPMDNPHLGYRRSYLLDTRQIAGTLLRAGVQTIVFARARLTTEVLLGYIREEVGVTGVDPESVRGYRGGYLPAERREIERGLREGDVRGVVATNALELGIDIGALDAVVVAGYPGTIASTWQQIGRAGRRAGVSLGILVASGGALDQYIVSHPRYLFERSPEHALIHPDNTVIHFNHLRCAAYELPFARGERFGGFDPADEALDILAEAGELHRSNGSYRWIAEDYPAAAISLRTGSAQPVVIQDVGSGPAHVIGQIDRETAPLLVHGGAIYLHEGRQYVVEALDWENGAAYVRPTEADYYTQASGATSVSILETFEESAESGYDRAYGRVRVTQQVTTYRIIQRYTHEVLGYGEISLPPQEFETTAYWMAFQPETTARLAERGLLLLPNNYGPNWNAQREAARARDGCRCTRCGAHEPPGREHHVHHVTPFRQFGYVPGENDAYLEANQLSNLITLCPSCHRAVEAMHGTRSALAGLVNALGSVAVLLLMCAPGDIGLATETAVEPTLTIYDGVAGGLGFAERLYELHADLLEGARALVRDCACLEGCPACVGPVGEVGVDAKAMTLALLEELV